MERIIYCLAFDHDWRWTLAAGLIGVLGVGTSLHLLFPRRRFSTVERRRRVALGSFIGGLTAFSTHFLAMQGYLPGGEFRYDVGLTIASLFVVLAALGLACGLAMMRPSRPIRGATALLAFSGIVAMHFLGMAALEFPGRISWDTGYAVLSVIGGLTIAGISGLVLGRGTLRLIVSSLGGALSIMVLHFTAIAGMSITQAAQAPDGLTVSSLTMTAVLAAMMTGIVGVVAVLTWLDLRARSGALARIREAIDAMPDGMAFYDADDRLALWNHRYAEVNPELSSNLKVGMTFLEIIKIGLSEGLYADAVGREDAWIVERLESRKALTTTIEQRIAGNRWLRVSDRRTAAGGIVTVCTDITDLKNHAAALAEARDAAQAASSAKSQFLANMSHEIRTPLNGVIGLAQVMARTDLSTGQREMLELIQSSGRTLQVLLSDILDLARVESGRLELSEETFDLGCAVREAARLYESAAKEKGLQFFVEIAPEADRWIAGDMVRLKQILTNLVSNAVKFTSTGFVSLTAAPGPDRDGSPTLRFSVEDTGIGFDSETRDRLFSRFEQADGAITRKFGGSGLGLAISRQLAEMMDGDLDCESEPGGGSAFILTIPFRPVEQPAAAGLTTADAHDGDQPVIRVLLADDHPVNRKVVELILTQAPVEIVSVEDGAQALQACRDGDYDLILMDMQMPVMDGLTATREIRLHEAAMGLPRTPIVMLTANALPEHVAMGEAAGADRHLAKPFDAGELLELVITLPRAAAEAIAA